MAERSWLGLLVGSLIRLVTLLPEKFELVHSELVILDFPAAALEKKPLEVVNNGQGGLNEQDGGCVDADGEEDDALFGFPGHEEVDVEEDEGKDCVVEEPE